MKLFGFRRVAWAAAAGTIGMLGSAVVGMPSPAGAATGAGSAGGIGAAPAPSSGPGLAPRPIDVTLPATTTARPVVSAATPALATWAGSFSYGGRQYPFRMVGTSPTVAKTSRIPVTITPIKIVLADGFTAYPTGAVSSTSGSALFRTATFKTGTTQYGDAIQRAEFWTTLRPASHSLLGGPSINPMVTLRVPAADGSVVFASDGQPYAAVNIAWLDARLRAWAAAVPADTLPIYLSYETYLYQGGGAPGIGGYHSAVTNRTGQHTYAYASWVTGDAYGASSANLAALSHEVAEWFNDPYVDNVVPRWTVANQPQYGCSNMLEVGDPLVGTVWRIRGLNFQDEAFFSWFARQKPSIGFGHVYSYLGTFRTYAKSC